MIVEAENTDDKETSTSEFPEVREEAIVKPEEERPAMSRDLKKRYQEMKINTMTKV
jgi:hypothetical protein